MTLTDEQRADILDDHYMVEGERHQHPRFGPDSPDGIPGTTDYACAADGQPWPCDAALIGGKA